MDRFDIAQSADNRLWDWDLTTSRIHFSPAWISMLGENGSEFGNTPEEWFHRIHPDELDSVKREIDDHLEKGSTQFEIQHRLLHKDGCYRRMLCRGVIRRDDIGRAVRIMGCHLDVAPDTLVDSLTGLPNHLLLVDRLARSVEKAQKNESYLFATLIVDLDLFESGINRLETINSNSLIIAAARRLETSLRDIDSYAHRRRVHLVTYSGGEEFTILLDGLADVIEARLTAEQLLKEMLAPFDMNGREVFLRPSIGIALSATGYRHADDVLRDADTALYRAKALGKSRCEVFDTAVLESTRTRQDLGKELQGALIRKELLVHYQPIVRLSSNQIIGFEALVRWQHPTRGLVPPNEFIPIAEKSGLIVPLDRWVIQNACRQLKEWQNNPGNKDLWISVNLSAEQFMHASLAKEIREILIETGLDAECLTLEVTEGAAMKNPETAQRVLMQLRVLGAKVALDDFGIGYSSLSHLRRLPLDFIKIDYAFVKSIENNPDHREIIHTISALAHQLGLRVIAEGIETARQRELILSLGCEYGQGFLFSRAVGREQAAALLQNGLAPPAEEQDLASTPDKSGEAVLSTRIISASPIERISLKPGRKRFLSSNRIYVPIGLSVLTLLLVGGILARLDSYDSPPVVYPSQPGQAAGLQSPVTEAAPIGSAAAMPVREVPKAAAVKPGSTSPAVAPKAAKKEAKKEAPAPVHAYPVIHDHRLGNCKGILTISENGISFNSEKSKDSFDFKYSECSIVSDRDKLTVRTETKVFRFKSAAAGSKDENRSHISDILQCVSRYNPAP